MPIYEYACQNCGQVFEVLQKHSDPTPTHSCGSSNVIRQISGTSFVLKGTGWYATDYGQKPSKSSSESSSGSGDS